ncbi:MAG: hypothetical protein Q7S09_02390 [bacterium]|nr:hypothetical protein [bacterium]
MVTPQVVDYIKSTLAQGYAEEKVRDALVKKGWNQADVGDAFRIARGMPATQRGEPVLRQTPQSMPGGIMAGGVGQSDTSGQTFLPAQKTSAQAPVQTPQILQPSPAKQESPLQGGLPREAATRQPSSVYPQTQTLQGGASPITPGTPQTPINVAGSFAKPQPLYPATPPESSLRTSYAGSVSPGKEAGPGAQTYRPAVDGGSAQGAQAQKPPPLSYQTIMEDEKGTRWLSGKRLLIYVAAGIVLLFGTYVFVGAKYGLYVFGMNLFPFEGVAEKIGLVSKIQSPSPLPSENPSPSLAPTITPAPTPSKPQINGRLVSLYGADSEAGTVAVLSYSPDKKKIVYTLLADGQNLWIMDLGSGSKENILKSGQINFPPDRAPVLLAWSPDGTSIAVVGKRADGVADLYLVNPVSRSAIQLTQSQTSDDSVATDPMLAPRWNKSGSLILAFSGNSLWKISQDALQKTRITPNLPIGSFDWSGGDTYITYTIRRQNEENVWVMDNDGRNFKQLTFGGINQIPRFGQDGALVYYVSYDPATKQSKLWSIKRDGSSVKQLANVNGGAIREFAESPALLQDEGALDGERHIIFVSRSDGGKQSLWMVQKDGNGLEEILVQGEFEPMGFVAWGNDGKSFYTAGLKHFLMMIGLKADDLPKPSPSPVTSATPLAQ